ncbi:hypothetical protein [Tunturiibacter psychrotolerans]|uniref:hypothetical protein n=1 Tax=Tunturiibacter psychrotolerans TaxID=3069686 RepID=UPI003D23DB3C
MQASIKKKRDGSMDLRLDKDAASAMFASVLFASRFHEGIAPLARVAEDELLGAGDLAWRKDLCQ